MKSNSKMGEVIHRTRTYDYYKLRGALLYLIPILILAIPIFWKAPAWGWLFALTTLFPLFTSIAQPWVFVTYCDRGLILIQGIVPVQKRKILLEDIESVSIAFYSPKYDFSKGLGMTGKGEFANTELWVLNTHNKNLPWLSLVADNELPGLSGLIPIREFNIGILIETSSGKDYLVGDRNPEETLMQIAGIYPVDLEPYISQKLEEPPIEPIPVIFRS